MRTCTKCNRLKPISEFHRNKAGRHGINAACKECVRKKYPHVRTPYPGKIYIISNPAWPEYYKIGKTARNVNERFMNYLSYSPLRDYKLEFVIDIKDVSSVEILTHKKFNARHEWCEGNLSDIIAFIKSI